MVKERISRFIQEASQDVECVEIMEDLIESCGNYVAKVNDLEAALLTARYRIDGDDYRKYISNLESSRSKAQNALTANVKILNRLCSINNIEPPLVCNVNDKVSVEDMAFKIVDELFIMRRA